jgi:hypothetical protein
MIKATEIKAVNIKRDSRDGLKKYYNDKNHSSIQFNILFSGFRHSQRHSRDKNRLVREQRFNPVRGSANPSGRSR